MQGDGSGIPRYHFGSPTRDVVGEVEAMALYAGEAVGLVHGIEPAEAIVSELALGWPCRPARPTGARGDLPLGRALRAALARLAVWAERHRQRRALLELSDHLLKDLGLSRADALREGGQPFWRG